jgi:hypothetical protein
MIPRLYRSWQICFASMNSMSLPRVMERKRWTVRETMRPRSTCF